MSKNDGGPGKYALVRDHGAKRWVLAEWHEESEKAAYNPIAEIRDYDVAARLLDALNAARQPASEDPDLWVELATARAEVERLRKGIEEEVLGLDIDSWLNPEKPLAVRRAAHALRALLDGGPEQEKSEPPQEVDDTERQAFRAGYDKGWEDRAKQPDTHMVENYSPNFRWVEYRGDRKGATP